LLDIGPVTYPAYPDTTVAARSREGWQKEVEAKKAEDAKAKAEQRLTPEQERAVVRKYKRLGRLLERNKVE